MKKLFHPLLNIFFYLLVFVVIQGVFSFGISLLWGVLSSNEVSQVTVLIVSTIVSAIVTMVLFLSCKWCRVSRGYIRTRPFAVIFWSIMATLGTLIPSIWLQEYLAFLPNLLEDHFELILKDRFGYFVVGLLVPIVEEMVFRGAILREFLLWRGSTTAGTWMAILLSAILFSLVHANPAQMPHAFLVGILLGWMYSRTHSIVPGIVVHWVNNTVAYICVNLLSDPDMPLIVFFQGSQSKVYLALIFSLCIFIPSIFQLNIRMKKAE